jgi:hypothetical protein
MSGPIESHIHVLVTTRGFCPAEPADGLLPELLTSLSRGLEQTLCRLSPCVLYMNATRERIYRAKNSEQ